MNDIRIDNPTAHSVMNGAAANRDEQAARQAAIQFEALLLNQLTTALQPSASEDEDNIFSSTGADMYRQMFSEQIAKIMSENGGVGIADTIMRQIRQKAAGTRNASGLIERAAAVVNDLKVNNTSPKTSAIAPAGINAITGDDESPISFQAPLEGRITSNFGARQDPINGQHRQHHGLDIAAPRGTPIGAAANGTVVFAGRRGGYGNTVIIEQADGRQTLYAHADQLLVNVGDQIQAGQTIATVGSTGRSTGPHLHFEVRENGQPVDPLTTLTKDFSFPRR